MSRPSPLVLGLTICRDFIRDPDSGNYTVVRSFTGSPVDSFPGVSEPFCVFAILTEGFGEVPTELVVTYFGKEIFEYAQIRGSVRFADPLKLVDCVFRFQKFPFPEPGVYLFTLLVDGEWAAQKAVRVYTRKDHP
jgi:hypothetical protein